MKPGLLFTLIFCYSAITFAQKRLVVAADGSGQFRTVQEAFDAVPGKNSKHIIIFVKDGIYKEKLHLDSGKRFVELAGQSKFNTILTYDDHTGKIAPDGKVINTQTSYSCLIAADDFTAHDVTFANDAGFTAGQAVALECRGDRAVFINCRFVGNQDIVFLNSARSRQFYQDCYIEGTTDFIFGAATAWFQQCHIHSKKNSHVTAASTPQEHSYGFVFNDCVLTGDTSLHKVSLGRPWRPYASVVYLHCFIGAHIMPDGWANWNQTESYKTTRYSEFDNYGPGAISTGRVKWSHQLSATEAKIYTIKNILAGPDNWNPLAQIKTSAYEK